MGTEMKDTVRKDQEGGGRIEVDRIKGTGSGYRNEGHNKEGPGRRGLEGEGRKEGTE